MPDYFDVIESKIVEAEGQLRTMGQVIIHPAHRPGALRHLAALRACPGTIIGHMWHEPFNAAINAFLAASRSVPNIISNRFGYDQHPRNKSWLSQLDAPEVDRRKLFDQRFSSLLKPFLALPLNAERNETQHGSGMAHWEVVVQGAWGTYAGGPLQPLKQLETRSAVPGEQPLGWLDGAYTRELQMSWTDFWWVIPQSGQASLRLPLFAECNIFVGHARSLAEQGKQLFNDIHKGQPFTLPPW
jgi:hypothetical protein